MIEEVLGSMQGKILKSDVREIINRPSGQFTAFDAKRLVRAMKELGWKDEKKLRFGSSPAALLVSRRPGKGASNRPDQDQLRQQQACCCRRVSGRGRGLQPQAEDKEPL